MLAARTKSLRPGQACALGLAFATLACGRAAPEPRRPIANFAGRGPAAALDLRNSVSKLRLSWEITNDAADSSILCSFYRSADGEKKLAQETSLAGKKGSKIIYLQPGEYSARLLFEGTLSISVDEIVSGAKTEP